MINFYRINMLMLNLYRHTFKKYWFFNSKSNVLKLNLQMQKEQICESDLIGEAIISF